jgi:hypothetical protein
MDESWSQTNVKYCAESAIIRYIFSVMYEKNSVCSGSYRNKKANVTDNVCIQLIEQFKCCYLTLKTIGRVSGNYVFFVTLSHVKNSVCNSIISVFQLVDPGVLFELVKGMEIKCRRDTIMYSFN